MLKESNLAFVVTTLALRNLKVWLQAEACDAQSGEQCQQLQSETEPRRELEKTKETKGKGFLLPSNYQTEVYIQ